MIHSGEYKGDFFEALLDRTCIASTETINVDTIMNNKSTLRELTF